MNEGEKTYFKCHKISGGYAKGKAILSNEAINFYQTDYETGQITEKNHALNGKSVADKIVVFPAGKGSSQTQGDGIYMLMKNKVVPKAMIVKHPDTVLVTAAIVMKIPLVDRLEDDFYEIIKDGDILEVQADKEFITLE